MLSLLGVLYLAVAIWFLAYNGLGWEERRLGTVTVSIPFGLIWSVLWPIPTLFLVAMLWLHWHADLDDASP